MGVWRVVGVLVAAAGVVVVGYGVRLAARDPQARLTGLGYALFGLGVAGYTTARLLGEGDAWTWLTWLALGGPVLAFWGSQPWTRTRPAPSGEDPAEPPASS